MASVVTVVT